MNSLITIVCCKNCVFINGPNCVGYSCTLEIGVLRDTYLSKNGHLGPHTNAHQNIYPTIFQ